MDSAIPYALRCPRTRIRRIEDDYAPPFPAWVARAESSVGRVAMGYFGVQALGKAAQDAARAAFDRIVADLNVGEAPRHYDRTQYVDPQGYDTWIAIAYWTSPALFERWRAQPAISTWWDDPARLSDGVGYFREILFPAAEGFETLFSSPDALEGVGVAMGAMSAEEIQEHGYWGSMRERLALSQTDAMASSGNLAISAGQPGFGRRVRLAGHENVAVIRSGQDWRATSGHERALYLEQMEPVLRAGMDFLRDGGLDIGCYSNRYMRHIDVGGQPIEKSLGYSYWRSLSALERWAESHPTHVEIFSGFMRMAGALNFRLRLRLYHEVSVLKSDQQDYEYVNCHPETGLLNGL
jgi:aldoxime dehydratase